MEEIQKKQQIIETGAWELQILELSAHTNNFNMLCKMK